MTTASTCRFGSARAAGSGSKRSHLVPPVRPTSIEPHGGIDRAALCLGACGARGSQVCSTVPQPRASRALPRHASAHERPKVSRSGTVCAVVSRQLMWVSRHGHYVSYQGLKTAGTVDSRARAHAPNAGRPAPLRRRRNRCGCWNQAQAQPQCVLVGSLKRMYKIHSKTPTSTVSSE